MGGSHDEEKINTIKQPLIKCYSCNGKSANALNFKQCSWCDNTCHIKCIKNQLGCTKCCEQIIPGYYYMAWEITNIMSTKNNVIFNPYDPNHIINQIGKFGKDRENNEEQQIWNKLSDTMTRCKYYEPKQVQNSRNNELKILSLNVRSLNKNINKIAENANLFEKFDILCVNETSCNIESLPNGIDDITLDGFHPPIVQAPARKSCKGVGSQYF